MRIAAGVPLGGVEGDKTLERDPNHRRDGALRLAPTETATIAFHMRLSFHVAGQAARTAYGCPVCSSVGIISRHCGGSGRNAISDTRSIDFRWHT
jgi:hypothetical protein